MVNMEERKASDILLELELKIDTILGLLKNIDFTNKIIMNRLSGAASPLNQSEGEVAFAPAKIDNFIPEFKDADQVKAESTKTRKSGKITVQQPILHPDGSKVILGNIEIFDMSNKLVKKTKTNSLGKWSALLDIGKYLVKVTKVPTNGRPLLDKQYMIDINPLSDETTMELEPPV